jgi:hypothetical protein
MNMRMPLPLLFFYSFLFLKIDGMLKRVTARLGEGAVGGMI